MEPRWLLAGDRGDHAQDAERPVRKVEAQVDVETFATGDLPSVVLREHHARPAGCAGQEAVGGALGRAVARRRCREIIGDESARHQSRDDKREYEAGKPTLHIRRQGSSTDVPACARRRGLSVSSVMRLAGPADERQCQGRVPRGMKCEVPPIEKADGPPCPRQRLTQFSYPSSRSGRGRGWGWRERLEQQDLRIDVIQLPLVTIHLGGIR